MRKKEGYFLAVYLDHMSDSDPVYIWIGADSVRDAIDEADYIMGAMIGWNDYFLGRYSNGYLEQIVRE